MDSIIFVLVTVTIMSILDFTLCYMISHNIIGNKVRHALKAFTLRDGIIAFSYASSVFFLRLLERYNYTADAQPFILIIMTCASLMVIISVTKRNNFKIILDEILIMFLIYFLIVNILITSALMPLTTIDDIGDFLYVVVAIILTTIFLCFLDKIDFNKLFVFISHRLALKITIFSIFLISLLMFFLIPVGALNFLQTSIPLGIFISLVIIGLAYTLKIAHQYEVVVPEKYHDMKKILTLLNLKAGNLLTVEDLREAVGATIELMEVKVTKSECQKSEDEPEDFKTFIEDTINSLKLNHKSKVEIRMNIQYFEPHKTVSTMTITHMLGILLENAIESKTKCPVFVDILSTEHILFIKVANETESKTSQELGSMLAKGYSTKARVGRGFGLSNLKKLVEKHQGNLTISQEMNSEVQANYLVFMLNF